MIVIEFRFSGTPNKKFSVYAFFVNIPLTTPRINFRISECHHRFSIDLIVIFSAKNGKLFLDHTDPLIGKRTKVEVEISDALRSCRFIIDSE